MAFIPKSGGASADEIWGYSNRTLTQTKFPFWSSIITQQAGLVYINSSGCTDLDIQPPSGETWLVWIDAFIDNEGSDITIEYKDYDGTTARLHKQIYQKDTYSVVKATISVVKILTNSLYAKISFCNPFQTTLDGYYGYSGFELSKRLLSLTRIKMDPNPYIRKPTQEIPDEISMLDKDVIVEINYHGKYRLAIMPERDVPISMDPRTNFPVERYTVYSFADDFIKKILIPYKQKKLDIEKTGWKKYFEKWGIL